MAKYTRETWIDAPLADVWTFHSRIDGLEALTPGWMNLRIEAIRGPDGAEDPERLEVGTEIRLSLHPFGVGPRHRWTSRIVAREEYDGAAFFRDTMADGPFEEWTHTHSFFADERGTRIRDSVEYQLPGGAIGELLGPLSGIGFEPMFRYRHRRTKELLGPD